MFGCGQVTSYYVSSADIDTTCAGVREALQKWGVVALSDTREHPCSLHGSKQRYGVNVQVEEDAQVPDGRGGTTAISEPHESVVIITVTRA
jgi:hypothetical protein